MPDDRLSREPAAQAGLAHVATASFLASRVVPTGGYAVALAGGVALARAALVAGLRTGYGASIAAMLQAIAVIGPSRVSVPLTQALSAPLLGRMHARGTLVSVWTIDRREDMQLFLDLGVDAVITNRVADLVELLERVC
jgi:glycerophosphoryl diester phosphodiesterase